MKTIVTGASGNYGSAAVRGLLDRIPAKDLILISRTPAALEPLEARGASVRYGDYDDPESLRSAFAGGAQLLLISGVEIGKRVQQHRAAIDAASDAGVRKIVYTSMVGLSEANPAHVGQDHLRTEELLKASGLECTILRDQHYADNMVKMMGPRAVQSGTWHSAVGHGREAFVWRDDCVNCAVAVLTGSGHAGRTYNITGPELLNMRDLAAMISEVSGRPIDFVDTDDETMFDILAAAGFARMKETDVHVGHASDAMVSFERAIREGFLNVISDDVELLTGRAPRSVRQMVEDSKALFESA